MQRPGEGALGAAKERDGATVSARATRRCSGWHARTLSGGGVLALAGAVASHLGAVAAGGHVAPLASAGP